MSTKPLRRKDHKDYKVGWICALPKEQTAAVAMLDVRHASLSKSTTDYNTYTLGSIGDHDIVIACLPKGKYGTTSAATVATRMLSTFPAIRFGLMVGIGGGIPPKVRLGDVVVSVPTDQYPGVVQWDMGKAEQGGTFRRTGALNNPPTSLLTALTILETEQAMNGSRIPEFLDELARKYPRLTNDYLKSESLKDILFKAACHHANGHGKPDNHGADGSEANENKEDEYDQEAEEDCRHCDPTQIIKRKPRDMKIHYGLIASGDQVIKDAARRRRLVKELGGSVLCVETEAAGLVDNFPCIVVRGICAYADSHKNKAWQEHAAAVAAAFTKELLGYVTVGEVEGEKTVKDILSSLSQTATSIQGDTTDIKQLLLKKEDTDILNWLSTNHYGTQQSDTLKRWHPETGQWLLTSADYQDWLQTRGRTLYCPGIPGSGKTIMAAAIIHDITQRFSTNPAIGLAYVYFTFSRQQEQTIEHILASLLMQLLRRQSSLPKSIHDLYEHHTKNGTQATYAELSAVLSRVVSGYDQVFIVLDALDECTTESQCRAKVLTDIMELQSKTGTNVLATSRVHDEIASRLSCLSTSSSTLPILARDGDVRVVLDSQMKAHDQELFDGSFRELVASKVIQVTEGMFLLAQLHLNVLIGLPTRGKIKRALEGLATGPTGLHAVYELAMARIASQGNGYDELAKLILLWIVHARRPLSALEIRHALSINPSADRIDEDDIPTVKILKSVCAGLVTIDEESGMVRLVHYTIQGYLEQTGERWFRNVQEHITQSCITYLSFSSFDGYCETDEEFEERLITFPFYSYAASEWGHHARANSTQHGVIEFLRKEMQTAASIQALFAVRHGRGHPLYSQVIPRHMNGLHLAALFGLHYVVGTLLDIYYVYDKDSYGRATLSWAAMNGHLGVVKLLLATENVDIDAEDSDGRTPLSWAAEEGRVDMVKLLLATEKVDVDAEDIEYGRTPLSWAAECGHLEVVKALLATKKVDINTRDYDDQTPLLWAARNRHAKVVEMLLHIKEVDAAVSDKFGWTVLMWAAGNGHLYLVKMVLDTGELDVNAGDDEGRTPLSRAAENGSAEVVKLLLNTKEVIIDARDCFGWVPLTWAAKRGHTKVIKLLLWPEAIVSGSREMGV